MIILKDWLGLILSFFIVTCVEPCQNFTTFSIIHFLLSGYTVCGTNLSFLLQGVLLIQVTQLLPVVLRNDQHSL